jgi:hypothetical protein
MRSERILEYDTINELSENVRLISRLLSHMPSHSRPFSTYTKCATNLDDNVSPELAIFGK